MPSVVTDIRVRGLGRQKLGALAQRARRLGMTPEKYVKHLVEEDLAVSKAARSKTFAELLGPGRAVNEQELDRLVGRARTDHQEKNSGKKR